MTARFLVATSALLLLATPSEAPARSASPIPERHFEPRAGNIQRGGQSEDLLCSLAAEWPSPVSKQHRKRSLACSDEPAPQKARIIAVGDDRRRALLVRSDKTYRVPIEFPGKEILRFSVAAIGTRGPVDFRISARGKDSSADWQRRLTGEQGWVAGELHLSGNEPAAGHLLLKVAAINENDPIARVAFAEPRRITPTPSGERGIPNIVLYVIDTLRADHTPVYGYQRNTTPRLLRFADESITFDRAYSTAALTRPAVASILTGTYPSYHRAYPGQGLGHEEVTLAETLRSAGWSSWAYVANGNVFASGLAFDQGFDVFRSIRGDLGQYARTSEINRALFPLLEARSDEPFFLFVHAVDPHSPYDPPTGFAGRFQSGSYRGNLKPKETRARILEQKTLTAGDVARVRDLYDEEILYQDAMFGEFLDTLEKLGLSGETLILVVGDHGEEFQERGGWEHGGRLWEEQIRIPMILRVPGLEKSGGRRITEAVSLVDILPTVLGLYGLPPAPQVQGRDLSRFLLNASTGFPPGTIYAEEVGDARKNQLRSLTVENWKLLEHAPAEKEAGEPNYQLFDLKSDPEEQIDQSANRPADLLRMQEALKRFTQTVEKQYPESRDPVRLAPRTRRQLEALGYLDEP